MSHADGWILVTHQKRKAKPKPKHAKLHHQMNKDITTSSRLSSCGAPNVSSSQQFSTKGGNASFKQQCKK